MLDRPRLAPGWLTDVPLLVLLAASSASISWPDWHLATSLLAVVAMVVHLATRRRLAARLRSVSMRTLSAWVLLVSTAAVTVTGLLRWVGVPPEHTWHGGTGYLMLTALLWHLWVVRRRLLARTGLRSRRGRRSEPSSPAPPPVEPRPSGHG